MICDKHSYQKCLFVYHLTRVRFIYRWAANERSCYICSVISRWLRPPPPPPPHHPHPTTPTPTPPHPTPTPHPHPHPIHPHPTPAKIQQVWYQHGGIIFLFSEKFIIMVKINWCLTRDGLSIAMPLCVCVCVFSTSQASPTTVKYMLYMYILNSDYNLIQAMFPSIYP